MKKRIICILLAVLVLCQLGLPASAEETVEYPRDRVGKIKIYTTATEQTSWDAALHEESEEEYTILLKPRDIAKVAGVELREDGYQLYFTRGYYEVMVDTGTEEARIYLNTTGGEQFRLYQKLFPLPEMDEITDDNGVTALYLPLEKMLYLLNAAWYADNKTVFVCPTGENMWDLVGEWADTCNAVPTYAEVVGESLGEIYGNAVKFGLLSVADEVDMRIFSGFAFGTSKTTDGLLEMADPASTRLEGNEADPVYDLMQSINPGYGELLSRATSLYNVASAIEQGRVDTSIPAVVERMSKTLSEWTPAKVGSDMGTFLDTFGYINNAWDAVQTINRSRSWTQTYADQLAYLKDLSLSEYAWWDSSREAVAQIKTAAESLHSEYGEEFKTAVWETVKLGIFQTADIIISNSGHPAALAKNVYDSTIAVSRTLIPAFDEALRDADYHYLAKSQYDVLCVTRTGYINAIDELTRGGVTAEEFDQARLLGLLLSNGAGHCSYNLYLAEEAEAFLTKAQLNCGYALRFDNTSQYDARLMLNAGYTNLYSAETGAVREAIPAEYVQFPADQVIVTVQYISGEGEGYSYIYAIPRVHIPGNEDIANAVSFGDRMVEQVTNVREAAEGIAEYVDGDNPGDVYYWFLLDDVYATGGLLSMTFREISYYGGAHPIHGKGSLVYDLVTGEKLVLKGMLDSENTEASAQLINLIADALDRDYSGAFWGGTEDIAADVVESSAYWSIDREGLKVSFAPGTVAAYGMGYIEVTIPYSDLEGIFAAEYLPSKAQSVGRPMISAASESVLRSVENHFGDDSTWVIAAKERVNEVFVRVDGNVVVYANYLASDLVWLPEAAEYSLTYNGGEAETVAGSGE